MSRTFRRKKGDQSNEHWYTINSYHNEFWVWIHEPYEKGSKEYKAGVAKFHGDHGTHSCKEPGPGWFRNMYNTKPSRVGARNEIIKWLRNEEYEVVSETHPHLPYWT